MRINCESVVKNEKARLFYGILPLLECFLTIVVAVIFSIQSSYKWLKIHIQSLRTYLDYKILQLEKIAY